MSESDSPPSASPSATVVDFAARTPSSNWEQVSLAEFPQLAIWGWFKPTNAPHSAILRVPDETFNTLPDRRYLTMRRLLVSAGIDPRSVAMWNYCGGGYDAMGGTSPLLDHPLPDPPPGADPNVNVFCNVVQPVIQPQQPQPQVQAPNIPVFQDGGPLSDVFENIDVNWNSIVLAEKAMFALRKQLSAMLGRLNSLNRDLGPDERLHADRQDKADWQIARRWLRDVAKRVSQHIKAYDIGARSYAGQREFFEQTYKQKIVLRVPFDGMEQTQRDFESHRKTVQTLLMSMNSALQTATQDGERRAQQILSKIAVSVRASTSKR